VPSHAALSRFRAALGIIVAAEDGEDEDAEQRIDAINVRLLIKPLNWMDSSILCWEVLTPALFMRK
jgi:hypothetical protein